MASCLRGAFPPVDFLAVCLVRAIFFHLRDKRRSTTGHRAPAARRPSSPQQMAAAASSPSLNDSGCAELRPPPGGEARGGATSRSTSGREHRGGTCESPPGSRQDGGGGTRPPGLPHRSDRPLPATAVLKATEAQAAGRAANSPKTESGALAGTEVALEALEQEPQSPSRTRRRSLNERPNRSVFQAPRRRHIYRDASRCVSASQNPDLHTPTTFSIGRSFRRRADISLHKGCTSGPFPDWPVFRPLIGC